MKFAFKRGTSLLERSIEIWDQGKYSHTECIIEEHDDGTFDIASSRAGHGVRTLFGVTLDPTLWDIVDCPAADVVKAKAWFKAHNGEGYFYLGIIGFVIRPLIRGDRRRWFCSDACMRAAFNMHGSWRIGPNGMHDIVVAIPGSI